MEVVLSKFGDFNLRNCSRFVKVSTAALILLHVSCLFAQVDHDLRVSVMEMVMNAEDDVLEMDESSYRTLQTLQGNPEYVQDHRDRLKQLRVDSIAEEEPSVDRPAHKALVNYIFQREEVCSDALEQDDELAREVYTFIKKERPSQVDFNEANLSQSVKGHTCSAMALDFLARYIKECSHLKKGKDCKKCIKDFQPFYRASTTVFGSRQAAFNTINVDRDFALEDPEGIKERKIQSLANYNGIKLKPATRTVKLTEIQNDPQKFTSSIKKLKEGVYVIRALKPFVNFKMESFGHTMIFIKGKDFSAHYDNSDGLVDITNDVEGYIRDKLLTLAIPEARFYKAERVKGAPSHLTTEHAN